MITKMGLTVNQKKDETGQTIKLLGILVSSTACNGTAVSLALTPDRRSNVAKLCLELAKRKNVKVQELMAFAGILNLCAQVIPGSRCYIRSTYVLIGSFDKSSWVGLSAQFKEDCIWWSKLVTKSGICGKILTRKELSPYSISWDASTTYGIGGYFTFNQDFFSIPWHHNIGGKNKKKRSHGNHLGVKFTVDSTCAKLMPRKNTPGFHINYLELYACFISIYRWGSHLRGYSINCFTDSTSVKSWLLRLTGPELAIPLLKNLHLLLVEHDIEIVPHLVTSKGNRIADALSRGDMDDFYMCFNT
jgi:hypothetical protein